MPTGRPPASSFSTAPSARRSSAGGMAAAAILDLARARIEGGVKQRRELLGGVVVGRDRRSSSGSLRAGRASRADWMRISVLVMPMNSAAGTPLPQTSPTPSAMRPSSSATRSKKSPPTSRAGSSDAYVDAGLGGEFGDLGQQGALDDRRARHLVVALAAQDDLLRHASEGLRRNRRDQESDCAAPRAVRGRTPGAREQRARACRD